MAAVYVVIFHTLLVPSPNPSINPFFAKFVYFGGTGVFLFFVISGFSLALTMPRHEKSGQPAMSYGISRLFRIAPLFYAFLLYSIFRDLRWNPSGGLPINTIILNTTFIFNFFPEKQASIVWAGWTIGVEMIFYLLFLPIYRASIIMQILVGIVLQAIFVIMLSTVSSEYAWFSFLGFLPLFLIGMWTCALYKYLHKSAVPTGQMGQVFLLFGVVVLIFCATTDLAEKNVYLRVPIGIGYALMVLGCGLLEPNVLSRKLLLFFGRISYSLYLVHVIVLIFVRPLFPRVAAVLPNDLAFVVDALIVLSISSAVAYALHRFIEVPGVRLGKVAFGRLASSQRSMI